MTRETSGTHQPLGTRRAEVIARLVRGLTPAEANLARRTLLHIWGKVIGLMAIAMAVVVILDLETGEPADEIFWSHPFLFIAGALVPLFAAINYRRVKPAAPMTLETAEMLAPAARPCSRCGEVPLTGTPVCPSCMSVLRPLVVVLPGALMLLTALLVMLYRRGAFTG